MLPTCSRSNPIERRVLDPRAVCRRKSVRLNRLRLQLLGPYFISSQSVCVWYSVVGRITREAGSDESNLDVFWYLGAAFCPCLSRPLQIFMASRKIGCALSIIEEKLLLSLARIL